MGNSVGQLSSWNAEVSKQDGMKFDLHCGSISFEELYSLKEQARSLQ